MENKNTVLISIMLLSILLCMPAVAEEAKNQEPFGVVLVAHGSNNPELDCNTQVENLYNKIRSEKSDLPPLGIAYLRFANGKTLEEVVGNLQQRGIDDNILLVHLSPSSFSIRHRELRECITSKKADQAGNSWLFRKVVSSHPLPPMKYTLSRAMDDNPLIVQILSDHAQEILNPSGKKLPQNAEDVSLMLVSYGAIEELENILWDRVMEEIGEKIRRERGFREVACVSLRNHSADLIREQAIIDLVKTAKRLKKQGRVIVVPYVLCQGAFQRNLQSYLSGIVPPEDISEKGVISHPNTALWIQEVIAKGMNQPPERPVNRNWSLMDITTGDPIGTQKYGVCEN